MQACGFFERRKYSTCNTLTSVFNTDSSESTYFYSKTSLRLGKMALTPNQKRIAVSYSTFKISTLIYSHRDALTSVSYFAPPPQVMMMSFPVMIGSGCE